MPRNRKKQKQKQKEKKKQQQRATSKAAGAGGAGGGADGAADAAAVAVDHPDALAAALAVDGPVIPRTVVSGCVATSSTPAQRALSKCFVDVRLRSVEQLFDESATQAEAMLGGAAGVARAVARGGADLGEDELAQLWDYADRIMNASLSDARCWCPTAAAWGAPRVLALLDAVCLTLRASFASHKMTFAALLRAAAVVRCETSGKTGDAATPDVAKLKKATDLCATVLRAGGHATGGQREVHANVLRQYAAECVNHGPGVCLMAIELIDKADAVHSDWQSEYVRGLAALKDAEARRAFEPRYHAPADQLQSAAFSMRGCLAAAGPDAQQTSTMLYVLAGLSIAGAWPVSDGARRPEQNDDAFWHYYRRAQAAARRHELLYGAPPHERLGS
eukprot:CAMPEP_0203808560 /NCGR_PEP_ID=MMETSP0115-20131106/1691_1 /ASSEMBLY_ACC=CAM_ASM_000227 /TAXON_ID=33651 /ORGANISM="Bicosoecid sp, Strain ms1" /LENGTH=390 /DNA_ID=CAMNT_0050717251 /DNA_START=218 /DNA_END=1386 /DNA_ORIENTATION=+